MQLSTSLEVAVIIDSESIASPVVFGWSVTTNKETLRRLKYFVSGQLIYF